VYQFPQKIFCGMTLAVKGVLLSIGTLLQGFSPGCQFDKECQLFLMYTADTVFEDNFFFGLIDFEKKT
jgi:hypothetical protein